MITPKEYAIASPEVSATWGLPAEEHGVLMCLDKDGHRVTVFGDADYVRLLRDRPARLTSDAGSIPPGTFPIMRDGWPPSWD